jgi:FMN phosphatase YigB (HAD superfamily)
MYQTVIFIDLDGTLMINPFESAVWPAVVGELAQKTGLSSSAILQMIDDENGRRQGDETISPILAMDWDDITLTIARELGVTLTTNCTELVRAHAASHSTLLDNALEALRELVAPHRALVVATKGLAKYQLPVMDALGLTPYFTDIITPDTHSGLKKHRHFFGDWPQQAQAAMMVGDMYFDDVVYPHSYGFKTIWKPRASLIPDELYHLDPLARAQDFPYTPQQSIRPKAILLSLRELPATVTYIEQHCL